MVSMLKQERIAYRIIALAAVAVMLFVVCRIVYVGLIGLPYPTGAGDAGNIALTRMFMEKRSPYAVDSLDSYVPDINYSQSFVNSALAVLLCEMFALAPVNAHFIISLVSIMLSGYLGFMFVKRYVSSPICIPALTALGFVLVHWRGGYVSPTPYHFGMFLYILTLYVLADPNLRHKTVICSILVTLCFYTIPLSLFVFIPVLFYMLKSCRREALLFVLWMIGINSIIMLLISVCWPLYWTRVFIIPFYGNYHGEIADYFSQSAILIIQLLAPPAIVAFFVWIERIRSEDREWLNVAISAMSLIITAFIGVFLLAPHVLTDEEIDNWNRAYEYTRMYSSRGQIYFAGCLAYDQTFDFNEDNGDCLFGNDEIINDELVTDISNSPLPKTQITYARMLVNQNLKYRQALRKLAQDQEYALITIDDEYNIFNDDLLIEYGYKQIDSFVLQTGKECHNVAFYTLN